MGVYKAMLKGTVRSRLVPGLISLLMGVILVLSYYFALDNLWFISLLTFGLGWCLIIIGAFTLPVYLLGLKSIKLSKCLKKYGIYRDELSDDLREAERFGCLFVGKKYLFCARWNAWAVPINRLMIATPSRLTVISRSDYTLNLKFTHTFGGHFTDDDGVNYGFKLGSRKKDHEKVFRAIEAVAKIDPAVLNPSDKDFTKFLSRFNDARDFVNRRRSDQNRL